MLIVNVQLSNAYVELNEPKEQSDRFMEHADVIKKNCLLNLS